MLVCPSDRSTLNLLEDDGVQSSIGPGPCEAIVPHRTIPRTGRGPMLLLIVPRLEGFISRCTNDRLELLKL